MNISLYTVNSYTAGSDTEIVPSSDVFIMASIVICNASASDQTVSVKLFDQSGVEKSILVYNHTIEAGDSETFDLSSVSVPDGSILSFNASGSGLNVTCSGAIKV